MAICNNEGQMVKPAKKPDSLALQELCYESSPAACSNCFANKAPQDFFLRKQFIQSHFEVVDRFIAPSHFLAQRYIDWGLNGDRIEVIENLLDADESVDALPIVTKERAPNDRLNLAFFGQINRFKGIEVLFKALALLPTNARKQLHVTINGSGLEHQHEIFRAMVEKYINALSACVSFRGRYTSRELPSLMAASDWVVTPSTWWENSPVVILEAKKYGVPVICSNIGGMAEKITHGDTGRHFLARREESLAEQILWVLENRDERKGYSERIAASYPARKPFAQHISLYRQLLSTRDVGAGEAGNEVASLPLKRSA